MIPGARCSTWCPQCAQVLPRSSFLKLMCTCVCVCVSIYIYIYIHTYILYIYVHIYIYVTIIHYIYILSYTCISPSQLNTGKHPASSNHSLKQRSTFTSKILTLTISTHAKLRSVGPSWPSNKAQVVWKAFAKNPHVACSHRNTINIKQHTNKDQQYAMNRNSFRDASLVSVLVKARFIWN